MRATILTLLLTGAISLTPSVQAQFPGSTPIFPPQFSQQPAAPRVPPTILQNYYNRGTQPLSPYLNLLRGTGNLGVDYYYGVRPGTPNGGMPLTQQAPRGQALQQSQMQQGYILQAGNPTGADQALPEANKDVVLPPSGHGVAYGNVFGATRTGIPGASSAAGRGGFFTAPTTGTRSSTPIGKAK